MPTSPKHHNPYKDLPRADTVSHKIHQSSRWGRFSRDLRTKHPYCLDPFGRHGARVERARQAHHLFKIWEREDLAFSESWVIPVCFSCHASIESVPQVAWPERVKRWVNDPEFRLIYYYEHDKT